MSVGATAQEVAANVTIIVTSVIFAVLIILASVYFLVYFQHPEDKWVAWLPKGVVVLGMSLAAYNIFLLPLDVGIQRGQMYTQFASVMGRVCLGFYGASCIFVLVLVPFTVFWYEGLDGKHDDDDEMEKKSGGIAQFREAFKYGVPLMIMSFGVIGVLWYFIGYADVPVKIMTAPVYNIGLTAQELIGNRTELIDEGNTTYPRLPRGQIPDFPGAEVTELPDLVPLANGSLMVNLTVKYVIMKNVTIGIYSTIRPNIIDLCNGTTDPKKPLCNKFQAEASVRVSVFVYAVALVSLVGWCLFSVFGGVGLICLPLDLTHGFITRPKRISKETYLERKKILGEQAQILMDAGQSLQEDLRSMPKAGGKGIASRNMKRREKEFRTDVIILDYHYKRLEESFKSQGGNLLIQIGKLICGIVGALLSFMWIIHICLFMLPPLINPDYEPVDNFLNNFFRDISPIPFVGTVFYAIFTFYLLACTVKGVTKLGMRIVFITIHPMQVGETMMNSLVFNVGIILTASLAVAQFSTSAFSLFAQYSVIQQTIFGVNTQYLRAIRYAFTAFLFVLLSFVFLTIIYVVYQPPRKQRENKLNFAW